MSDRPLNERQERFCEAYSRLGTGARAAAAAGYQGTDIVMGITAARLLKDDRVLLRIKELGAATRDSKVMDKREREELLTRFARGEEPGEPKDRLKSVELLAKMHGDLLERREHSGPGGGPIAQTHQVVIARGDVVRIARGKGDGK